jgi:hypothetical protein
MKDIFHKIWKVKVEAALEGWRVGVGQQALLQLVLALVCWLALLAVAGQQPAYRSFSSS